MKMTDRQKRNLEALKRMGYGGPVAGASIYEELTLTSGVKFNSGNIDQYWAELEDDSSHIGILQVKIYEPKSEIFALDLQVHKYKLLNSDDYALVAIACDLINFISPKLEYPPAGNIQTVLKEEETMPNKPKMSEKQRKVEAKALKAERKAEKKALKAERKLLKSKGKDKKKKSKNEVADLKLFRRTGPLSFEETELIDSINDKANELVELYSQAEKIVIKNCDGVGVTSFLPTALGNAAEVQARNIEKGLSHLEDSVYRVVKALALSRKE